MQKIWSVDVMDVKNLHDERMCWLRKLRMITITCPFAVWGLDMVGPFKRSKDKKTHLLVVVDKFTKWVEAEPVSKCDATMITHKCRGSQQLSRVEYSTKIY